MSREQWLQIQSVVDCISAFPIELINRSRRGPYSKMNKSASLRSNEVKLREAARRNDLGVIRALLARRIDPNSRNEVFHSFSGSFTLQVDKEIFLVLVLFA